MGKYPNTNLYLAEQRDLDGEYSDRWSFQGGDWQVHRTRRISEWLSIATLTVLDGTPRQIKDEVLPGLAVRRARLMNIHELPEDLLDNAREPVVSQNDVVRELARSTGRLMLYVRGAERGDVADGLRLEQVSLAVANLHVAAEGLAHDFGVDLSDVHQRYLQAAMQADMRL